jgi:integrase
MKKRLTKAVVRAARPDPERDVLVWDTSTPGFGLRVAKGGAKSFILQYTLHGRERRVTLGRYGYELTVDQARDLAKIRKGEILGGRDPLREKQEARRVPTVAQAAERFLGEHVVHLSASSRRSYERALRSAILPAVGSLRLPEVRRRDLEQVHQRMRSTPFLANRTIGAASSLFEWCAVQFEELDLANPCRKIRRFPEPRRGQAMDAEQLARLGVALRDLGETTAVSAFLVTLLTGARPGEVLGMRWSDIDLEARLWNLPKAKTGRRVVYLGKRACDVLRRLPHSGGGLAFPGQTDRDQRRRQLGYLWYTQLAGAVPSGLRCYDATRHTFTSWAADLGVPAERRRVLVGHAPGRDVHSRYTHHAAAVLLEDADRVSEALWRALQG